jgi:UDP-glucose:(heptosyl)LPS alpha-1,3-glucosyltransferase
VVFLFVAYELKKKGIIPLMEATKILKDRVGSGFRVVVAGGKPSIWLSRRLDRLDLSKTVIFTGRIRNIEECYANGDVLVLPTFYDSCGLVVFEAMACKLPCITTRAAGAAGIITEGVDGFILDHPSQAEDLAGKMGLLLDPARRKSMGCAAANKVLGYTIQRTHQEVLRILDEVAGMPGEANAG